MQKDKKSIFGFIRYALQDAQDLPRRIMTIVATSAALANTIGFLANYLLHGMDIPTAVCAVCDILAVAYLLFGLRTKQYLGIGYALLCILIFIEFPTLVFAYGPVMYPYMILGVVTAVLLSSDKRRVLVGTVVGIYEIAVIVLSTFNSYVFGPQDEIGLLGSAVITFAVSYITISTCCTLWKSANVDVSMETDAVTGFLSRNGFLKACSKELEDNHSARLAILYFDIKNFKSANAVFGVDGGNILLREFGKRISLSKLKPINIARVHADHFVCLIELNNIDYDELNVLCKFEFSAKGKSILLYSTCGIYPITNLSLPIPEMIDRARSVRKFLHDVNNKYFAVFTEQMESSFQEDTRLVGEVEEAILNQSFEPFYQPIVDCKTGKIVSAEALARWIHKERGMISPGMFIPVLEQKELISELDGIIATKVNRFMEGRQEIGRFIVPISLNLSRVDLYDNEMMKKLQTMVGQSSILGLEIRLEVTESAYESLPNNVHELLGEFRKLGASLLIDDFGSGVSSLGMITDYEFDIIKMDMSFASKIEKNEKSKGVIRSIIELVHTLGAKVVAEGVETEAQKQFLVENGCDFIQGYYYYKPLPEADFAALLDLQSKNGND